MWQLAHAAAPNSSAHALYAHAAARFTAAREGEKWDGSTHDVGFMVFDSFGVGLTLDGRNQTYRHVLSTAAHTLATRYSAVVGMTRSWGRADDEASFEVIVDNLMNLELVGRTPCPPHRRTPCPPHRRTPCPPH